MSTLLTRLVRGKVLVRLIMAWICTGHVITGLAALISNKRGLQVGALLYGAEFEPSPQFRYIIRPLGVYILALAYLQAMAVRDPWRYRAVIDATLAVFAARQVQRYFFSSQIQSIFGISGQQHLLRSLYFLLLALLLLVARLRLGNAAPQDPPPPEGQGQAAGPGAPRGAQGEDRL
jgi:hypothetical protein